LNAGFRATTLFAFTLTACSLACALAGAQAFPTAVQPLNLSAFATATGTYTGLGGGRNLGITAGFDVGFKPFYRLYPTAEIRGTYPFNGGQVDAQENVLYGIKIEKLYRRFHPYGNFLVGRDKITYQNGGYPDATGTLLYLSSVSNIFSYGGGVDLDINDTLALKVDAQFQQIGVPVNTTGHIFAKPLSVGIVYRFDFNHHVHYGADGQVKGYKPPPEPKSAPVPPPATAPDNPAPGNPAPDSPPPATAPDSSPTPPPASDSKPSPDTPAPTPSTPQPQQPQ
jgi:hypothetical protein